MNKTIILRAHTEVRRKSKKKNWAKPRSAKWPQYALVFDCETRIDQNQSLTFGFARLLRNAGDNGYTDCRAEIVFYDPKELKPFEISRLRKYVEAERAETSKDISSKKIFLLTRQQFIQQFFFPHAEAESLIVGFNLCFDLTRIADDARAATRINEDWSLVFSYEDRKTQQMKEDKIRRIKITRKDGKIAFIKMTGYSKWKGILPSGRFLDLFTLAWALRNIHYSLKGLAKDLNVKGKLKHEPTGKVTVDEIKYCRQDVRATVGILNKLRTEFDCHPIERLPDQVYSPASIFKAYLQAMGIEPLLKKFRLSPKIQGIAAQAYYGGRSEIGARLARVPVVHTDFMSEYPTVITLMGLWDFVIANNLRVERATQRAKRLLQRIAENPDRLFDQNHWKEFTGFALVEPAKDILPIRTEYNDQSNSNNIGVNCFERSDYPIWFAIPDLIASVLLAGKVPKVLKAIHIFPEGAQRGLRPVALRGKEQIDPVSGNLFKSLIEAKEREKKNDEDQAYFLKIMANSGYGIFIETTPTRIAKPLKVNLFSGEYRGKTKSMVIEEKGKYYCPVVSSLITSGGRLLLAMLEHEVRKSGGRYLLCDTDSMAIISSRIGSMVRLGNPEMQDHQKTKALSWEQVRNIVNKFGRLNPYNLPGSILKIEKNSDKRQMYGVGVSAKRYCLFDEQYQIVHASSHGLGYLYVPQSKWDKKLKCSRWIREAWEFLISDDPYQKTPKWFSDPAMMRVAMSTPKVQIWKEISKHEQKAPLRLRCKPFNFVIRPLIAEYYPAVESQVDAEEPTLIGRFTKKPSVWRKMKYVNIHDGKSLRLVRHSPRNESEALPLTLGQIVRMHTNHPESKSLAPDGGPCTFATHGLLQRTPITAQGFFRLIGKETDRKWEQEEDPSLFDPLLVEYIPNETAQITTDAKLANAIRDCGLSRREVSERAKLNPSTVQSAASGKRIRKSSAARLWRFFKNMKRISRK